MSRKCVVCGWEDGACCATCRAFIENERTIRDKLWVERFAMLGMTAAVIGGMWLLCAISTWASSHVRLLP